MRHLAPTLMSISLTAFAVVAFGSDAVTVTPIEDCVLETNMDCIEAVSVGIAVANERTTQLEAVVLDSPPPNDTMYISLIKSLPRLRYPLRYLHTVPYYQYEEVTKVPNRSTRFSSCVDNRLAPSPTCGWVVEDDNRIPDSQGFCCAKNWSQVLTKYANPWWRGEEVVGQSTTRDYFSTAHCLRKNDIFFKGYEIGEPSTSYEVITNLKLGSEEIIFSLSPQSPIYNADNDPNCDVSCQAAFNINAELVGEFNDPADVPSLTGYILYIPSSPDSSPMVIDYAHNMLMVPREEVSADGKEYNKVGTSYHAFRRQGGQCAVSLAGDCLGDQLFHKHSSDLQRLTVDPNAETRYLVHTMRRFKGSMDFQSGMEQILQYLPTQSSSKSKISLTMDPSTIKVIEKESVTIIMEAYVEEFQAMSPQGNLRVLISNQGDESADVLVSVTDCTSLIDPAIPAQTRTLDPSEEKQIVFDINTLFNVDATHHCLVSLRAPTGRIYDSVWVVFDTTHNPEEL